MKKIGRNDPCPCGAKKSDGFPLKYKRCHLGKKYSEHQNKNIPPHVVEIANRFSKPPVSGLEYGGFLLGRPFIDTAMKDRGKRARAVGNKVYIRALNETFHEFILDLFGMAIDYSWIADERIKPTQERHPLSIWGQELVELFVKNRKDNDELVAVKQSGNIKSLLSMAYDYYSLCHCAAEIQPKFINRLKNRDNFQGAKYEMAMAGIAVRAGFDIVWLNDKGKHCEFKGVHKTTNDIAFFESKSHTREGVLGKGGAFDSEKTRIKILDHFREALSQSNKDYPLVIFDDINLPITADQEYEQKAWFQQIDDSFNKYGFYKKEEYKNMNYGALFITNFSWHYHNDLSAMKENEVVGYFHTGGMHSLQPETLSLLNIACKQYGFVPPKLEERNDLN